MRNQKQIWIWISIIVTIVLYFDFYFGLVLTQPRTATADPRLVNDTTLAILNVTNVPPRVLGVVVDDTTPSPPGEIDLISGYFRKVLCNATVVDLNGKDDITYVNATFFFIANKSSQSNDMNEHYSNRSCALLRSYPYNKSFSCAFNVWFFANNGTWYCNVSAWDIPIKGKAGYNSSLGSAKMNPIYALTVPAILDFGEVALNKTSAKDSIENVTNTGNMIIDLQLHGYGSTIAVENNLSMKCTLGNITVKNERFSLSSGTNFDLMTNLSGQFASPNNVNSFDLQQRKSETQNSTKNTYWKIKVPERIVKGQCNGTIVFGARINV